MDVTAATDAAAWDAYLTSQRFSPFLQSWTMGEVYRAVKQEPIRLVARDGGKTVGIAFGHVVRARRGAHIAVPYGPVTQSPEAAKALLEALGEAAKAARCSFVRLSPFWTLGSEQTLLAGKTLKPAPLHLLAEHLWYLPLTTGDAWTGEPGTSLDPEELFKSLRATHRNLIRRAQKEGVTIERSQSPDADMGHFITLHDETRKRHGFTAYTNAFFRAQTAHFAPKGQATVYLARYQGEVIAASVHMHFGKETSYHHGASTHKYAKIPASYLLQWTAITDAIKRGDHVYNFWGIAPLPEAAKDPSAKIQVPKNHPFSGVTMFKIGFPGRLLPLAHCMDLPLSGTYWLTRAFEFARKWKRGF